MLLKKTYLDKSPIHGIGLFAAEPIAEGDLVWTYMPGFDLAMPQPKRGILCEFLNTYASYDPLAQRYIVCLDNARFINHSETPNIYPEATSAGFGLRGMCDAKDRARFNIAIGEEITIHYGMIDAHFKGFPKQEGPKPEMNQSLDHLEKIATEVFTREEGNPEADLVICANDLLALIEVVKASNELPTSLMHERLQVALKKVYGSLPLGNV